MLLSNFLNFSNFQSHRLPTLERWLYFCNFAP